MIINRDTKYSKHILNVLGDVGHATNADLLDHVRALYPDVSATTVHRASSRLHERGLIGMAPADSQGSMRYDSVLEPHDHFICGGCEGIRNIDIAGEIIPKLSRELGGCKVTGRLVIYGSCEKCLKKKGCE